MAVEKGKVKAALDTKYKGTSLTKELKEGYAEVYADLIENEEGIEAFLNTQDAMIRLNMKDADRRSQAAAAKARQEAADAAAGKTENKTETPAQPDTSTMTPMEKQMFEMMQAMQTQLAGFQAAQQTKSISERFNSESRLKGIHPSFLKNRVPADEAGFEQAIEDAVNDWKELAQAQKFSPFGNERPAAAAQPGAYTPEGGGKVDPAITAFAARKVQEIKQTQNK